MDDETVKERDNVKSGEIVKEKKQLKKRHK
jgi:hypothetical protein